MPLPPAKAMQTRPIAPGLTFGAVVTGADLARLAPAEWSAIEAAFVERGVLVFKDQGHLTLGEQRAFAARWGTMDGHGAIPLLPLTNVKKGGGTVAAGTDAYFNLQGNEGWHIDNTYQPRSAKAGILRAAVLPAGGSETAFCDGRAAFEALDAAAQRRLEGLAAFHSGLYSQAKLGQDPAGATLDAARPGTLYLARAYLRPLVKAHPVTGRRALHIGRHAFGIPGLGGAEGDELLAGLLRFAAGERSRTHHHRWAVGDLVLWDNRRMLHRACPYPAGEERVFHGNRIGGDASEAALNADDPAPGAAELAAELRRIAAEPATFVRRELELRAGFDRQRPAL